MAAADAEALIAVLNACGKERQTKGMVEELLGQIATVFAHAPAATALDPRLQAAVAKCLAFMPQVHSCAVNNSVAPNAWV